ncbi:MAG: FAD binding domain-containing protein [Planctomycetota bacterium]|nr:FAD binding domain-containing protein [Planctomycetota bacterium]
MLRLPTFELHKPTTVAAALEAAAASGPATRFVAGGTDLLPNLKHEMIEADHLVSLAGIESLRGIRLDGDDLVIGPMTSLTDVASSELVQERAPALAQAAGVVAGPQHRNQGTLGGNVMLDTRCQWINQSYFWRSALGFCLKKDGTECHVIEGGKRCVAAVSNDSIAPLYTVGAKLVFQSLATPEMIAAGAPEGVQTRPVPVDALFKADGAYNKKVGLQELLTEIRIPALPAGHRGSYQKLRLRGSIDFPQLGIAARLDLDEAGVIVHADVVAIVVAARPVRVKKAPDQLVGQTPGTPGFEAALAELCDLATRSVKALPNIPGDTEWRQRMVPVLIEDAIRACV